MPRQRIHHNTISRDFPADFPQRLKRFEEESRLPWAELALRLGVYPHTAWRWQSGHSLWNRWGQFPEQFNRGVHPEAFPGGAVDAPGHGDGVHLGRTIDHADDDGGGLARSLPS